jgi:uncharacterized protein
VTLLQGTALVTGATGGMGQAIVRALAERGVALVLTGRREEPLQALAGEVGARAVPCDLGQRQELEALVEVGRQVGIDLLIANAALPASGELTELSQEQIDRMLEVNLRAPIALAKALVPGMIERRRGHVVFVSSLAGKAASPLSSVYSATKFGLRGFALGLRADLRDHDVGVSVVAPGFISGAGMFADANVRLPPGVGTKTPDDVAAGVITAIERNRAEVEVAPASLRLGAGFAGLAPQLAATFSRLMGGERVAREHVVGQRDKRW